MTPKQLEYFVTIIRLGGVSRAAERLGVSQATVSASIAGLRRELGDPLFHASRSGVDLTAGGQRLAHRAHEILGLRERTVREVAAASADRRPLRLVCTSLFAEYGAPGLCDVIAAQHRDIDLEFVTCSSDDFTDALLSGRAELAIGPRRANVSARQTSVEFLPSEVIAVSAYDASDRSSVLPWFVGPSALEPGSVVQFVLGRARIPQEQLRLCSSHVAAVDQARAGRGIALSPAYAVADAIANGRLSRVDDRRFHAAVTWTAYVLTERATSAANDVLDLLQTTGIVKSLRSGDGLALDTVADLAIQR